jgi:hypothetical protein
MMTLTREEQKSVVRRVVESHQGVTLTEAKSNTDIREEMKLNLEFYSALKEGFVKDGKTNLDEAAGMLGAFLGVMGNIKDFLTGTKVIKDITAWIKGIVEKLFAKLGPVVDKFVPQKIQDLAKDGVDMVKKFTEYLYNTFSYKGIAKVFAMIRYKTFKPTDEQKKCMELAGKIVYKWIIISLVAFFVIKFIITAWPIISAVAAKGGAATTQQAAIGGSKLSGLLTALTPIKAILAKLGHGSLFKGIFSTASAAVKAKDSKKVSNDIKAKAQAVKDKEINGFKDAWGYCPLPQK